MALVALALTALAACSYMTDFVVVNDSGSPVEVTYSFKNWRNTGGSVERPWKTTLKQLDDANSWQRLEPVEFSHDPVAGTVTVTLAPSEVVRVYQYPGWGGHGDSHDDELFGIGSLRITGANGTVYYEGKQAQYQFRWENDKLYKLTYYGWGDKR